MRITLLAGLALLVFSVVGLVADAVSSYVARDAPASVDDGFVIATEEHSFGDSLKQNVTYEMSVGVKNAGRDEIRIAEFKVDCGCVNVRSDKAVLSPGESTTVRASVMTGFGRGPMNRRIGVVYRHQMEGFDRERFFALVGRIVPEFEVTHPIVEFDRSVAASRTVTFTPQAGAALDLKVDGVSARGLSATCLPRGAADDGRQEIQVAFDPREYQGGQGTASVSVSTGNPVETTYSIRVVIR